MIVVSRCSEGRFLFSVAMFFSFIFFFFFQAEDGIRDLIVTGVQTCALPIYLARAITHSHTVACIDHHVSGGSLPTPSPSAFTWVVRATRRPGASTAATS